jgi:hypothetical protein
MNVTRLFLLVSLVFYPLLVKSQTLARQATDFIESLHKDQRQECCFDMTSEERFNWHFVPRTRKGISLHAMTESQRNAAYALLRTSLSEQGYRKATEIIALENILRVIENRSNTDTYRDPLNYSISFFGVPSDNNPWGWRIEGHHVSINFTSIAGRIESSTPTFWGSNPGTVPAGKDKGKQVLKLEMELGFALVNSLTTSQRTSAIIREDAPSDIISFNSRTAKPLSPVGISFTALNKDQQATFLKLLDVYVKNYELGFADRLMAKIRAAGIDKLSFAWAGSLNPGAGHYYCIQGPMLLIEYDNTQNQANHIHTTVRDLTNDFAEDILREHYEREHKK